jgi:hypothetical protein
LNRVRGVASAAHDVHVRAAPYLGSGGLEPIGPLRLGRYLGASEDRISREHTHLCVLYIAYCFGVFIVHWCIGAVL